MTCKFKMLNIPIYSFVCNMLYFFKQIMISKTFSNFSQLFWISTQERLGVLSKQKKIYRYWPKRVEKYGHIGKTPISCIPSNMHPQTNVLFCCDFFLLTLFSSSCLVSVSCSSFSFSYASFSVFLLSSNELISAFNSCTRRRPSSCVLAAHNHIKLTIWAYL